MRFSVTHNIPKVRQDLRDMHGRFAREPVAAAMTDLANAAEKRARRPNYGFTDRRGWLRASIKSLRARVSGAVVWSGVTAGRLYASFVEYGNRSRYSYLRRAVREVERMVTAIHDRRLNSYFRSKGF